MHGEKFKTFLLKRKENHKPNAKKNLGNNSAKILVKDVDFFFKYKKNT